MNSKNDNEIRYNILKKYFEDRASDEEKKLLDKWLNNDERTNEWEDYLRLLWKEKETEMNIDEPTLDMDSLLDRIHHRINLSSMKEKIRPLHDVSKPVISLKYIMSYLAKIAAILLLPLIGYMAWETYHQKSSIKNQVYNEIICPLGARSQFELPDGTKVNLNNGSKLKYPANFSGNTREVELMGEAFFDVFSDKNKPFIVKTVGLNVKVLGTRFNVYSYPGDSVQEFTVESGIIELIEKDNDEKITVVKLKSGLHAIYQLNEVKNETVPDKKTEEQVVFESNKMLNAFLSDMNQGQNAIYKMKKGSLNIKIDDPKKYTIWTDGKLVLRNDPMPRLLKRIERWYNVKFNVLDESINQFTYWATFEDENLDQVLNILSLTGPTKFNKRPREKADSGTYKIQVIDVTLKK